MNHILQLLVAGFYCPQLKPCSWKLSSPFNLGGRPTRQGVRARAVEKVQRQLAELPEEICVTNGLHWNDWSGEVACWNLCWGIWNYCWSYFQPVVFVQIWCLIIQSFSEKKLQNKRPMVALCRMIWAQVSLMTSWKKPRQTGCVLGSAGMMPYGCTFCQAVTDGHVMFLDDAIRKVPKKLPG